MENASTATKFMSAEQVPVTNPANVRAVYANSIGASATGTDFRLFFNELGTMPVGLGPEQIQELRAVVVLPLAAAQTLIAVLQQIIATAPQITSQSIIKESSIV